MSTHYWEGDTDYIEGLMDIRVGNNPSADAFGRLRSSDPSNIFDSKQIHDNQPLIWDDAEVSGGGTSSNHSTARASTTIGVSATTAGRRTRQTFRRFNYQPGKSLLLMMTMVFDEATTGINQRVGYFDNNNGIFLESDEGVPTFVVRSNVSGTPVENRIPQSEWNIDPMDGSGLCGMTLDITKAQILIMDMEWLGVGRVRFGFVYNGVICYAHEVNHANEETSVYMSTPNLPLRYEIENDGTGAAASLEHICSSAITEGGHNPDGITRHYTGPYLSALATTVQYAMLAFRLKSTHLDTTINVEAIHSLLGSNDSAYWELRVGGTPSAAMTFSDIANGAIQVANGNGTITHSGGTVIAGGFVSKDGLGIQSVRNSIRLGASIGGTPTVMYLVLRPYGNNLSAAMALTWRELA